MRKILLLLMCLLLICAGIARAWVGSDGTCHSGTPELIPGSYNPVKGNVTVTWEYSGHDCAAAEPRVLTIWTTYNVANTWIKLGKADSATATSFTFDSTAGLTPDTTPNCGYWFYLSDDSSIPDEYTEMGGYKYIDNVPSRMHVIYPNGGEKWSGIKTIKWTLKDCKPGDKVMIGGGTGGGTPGFPTSSFVIARDIDACIGAYEWNTLKQPTYDRADWIIRTTLIPSDGDWCFSESDWSDGFFTIDNPQPGSEILWLPIIMGAGIILVGGIVLLVQGRRKKGKKK